MMRLRIRPSVTAWRCVQMASKWMPSTNGVLGSRTGHDWRANSCRLRLAFSICKFRKSWLGTNQDGFDLLDLFVGEFSVVIVIYLRNQPEGLHFGCKPSA